MSEDEHRLVEIVRVISGALVLVGFVVCIVLVGWTAFKFWVAGRKFPALLKRDVVLFGGAGLAIAGNAAFQLSGVVAEQRPLWWVLFAGVATVVAIWGFAVWEWRVIRPHRPPEDDE